MCNNTYKKSTLEVFNPSTQTLAATTGLFQFTDILEDTGCSIDFISPSIVRINKSGLYLVLFTTNLNTGTTAGTISTVLNVNDIPVKKITTIATATASNRSIIIPKLISVPKSCNCIDNTKKITVINNGISADYSESDLIVIKLA